MPVTPVNISLNGWKQIQRIKTIDIRICHSSSYPLETTNAGEEEVDFESDGINLTCCWISLDDWIIAEIGRGRECS